LPVLIINNPGFGVPLDFIFLFFWGSAYRQLLVLSHPGLPLAPLTFPLQKAETVQRLREGTRAPEDQGADLITKKNGRTIGHRLCNEVEPN
jgi:hypothetical protein